MQASTALADIAPLLAQHIRLLTLSKPGLGNYRIERPRAAQPFGPGCLRIYSEDGVSHTHRLWFDTAILHFEHGKPVTFTYTPLLEADLPSVTLVPEGVLRIVGGYPAPWKCDGPIWFHNGPFIGLSEHERLKDGFANEEDYTAVNSHSSVFWWRDETF